MFPPLVALVMTESIYSGVPNKRGGGVKIIGGLEMVQYNSNRGVGIIGGGSWRNRK